MNRAAEVDQIVPGLFIWHAYDSAVKAELYSTGVLTAEACCVIDPIPIEPEALAAAVPKRQIRWVVVTNENHLRATVRFAKDSGAAILAHSDLSDVEEIVGYTAVDRSEKIAGEITVISIEGAVRGEIALHSPANGGMLIVGDSLINFDPYGFTLLPSKYCSDQKRMRDSLRQLLDFKFERILFAHGSPIVTRANERLDQLLSEQS